MEGPFPTTSPVLVVEFTDEFGKCIFVVCAQSERGCGTHGCEWGDIVHGRIRAGIGLGIGGTLGSAQLSLRSSEDEVDIEFSDVDGYRRV